MSVRRAAAVPLLVLALATGGPPARAAALPDVSAYPAPRVVLAQDANGPVLWWDATVWVERLLGEGVAREPALRALELEAVKLFVTRTPALPPDSRRFRVVAVFTKSGLVSGPYRTNAYEGVRTLLTVEGAVRPPATVAPGWEAAAAHGVYPPGVSVKPSADLPRDTGMLNGLP